MLKTIRLSLFIALMAASVSSVASAQGGGPAPVADALLGKWTALVEVPKSGAQVWAEITLSARGVRLAIPWLKCATDLPLVTSDAASHAYAFRGRADQCGDGVATVTLVGEYLNVVTSAVRGLAAKTVVAGTPSAGPGGARLPPPAPTDPRERLAAIRASLDVGDSSRNAQFISAFQDLELLAGTGDVQAQLLAGALWAAGAPRYAFPPQAPGLPFYPDNAKARAWWTRAAAQQSVEAMTRLAALDSLASAPPQADQPTGWLVQAARAGGRDAQLLLAGCLEGTTVRAVVPVEIPAAAYPGLPQELPFQGKCTRDFEGAIRWYQQALDPSLGDRRAAAALARLGVRTGQEPTAMVAANAAMLAGDKEEAAAKFRVAADEGNMVARFRLAEMYRTGDGVKADPRAAVTLYEQAANQGHADSQFRLALALRTGAGVPADVPQGIAWLRKAAEQQYAKAEHALGNLYEFGGFGTPRSLDRAAAQYALAVAHDDTSAAPDVTRVAALKAFEGAKPPLADPRRSLFGVEIGRPLPLPQCYDGIFVEVFTDELDGCVVGAEDADDYGSTVTAVRVNGRVYGDSKYLRGNLTVRRLGGAVERIFAPTSGRDVQDNVYAAVREKWGATGRDKGTVLKNDFGAEWRVYDMVWLYKDVTVEFLGSAGESVSSLFGTEIRRDRGGAISLTSQKWLDRVAAAERQQRGKGL